MRRLRCPLRLLFLKIVASKRSGVVGKAVTFTELSDDELLALVAQHGSQAGAARAMGVAPSTLKDTLVRRGLKPPLVRRELKPFEDRVAVDDA